MESHTIRRCRHCKEPAVVIVDRWEARLFGVLPSQYSGQTDHRCQSCGAGFSLRPPLLLWFVVGTFTCTPLIAVGALSVVGVPIALFATGLAEAVVLLVVTAVCLALGVVGLRHNAGPQIHAWLNPLVPVAAMPELRYGPPQDYRVCRCGVPAQRVGQRRFSAAHFPAGSEATYGCPGCGRQFTIPDRWALGIWTALPVFLLLTLVFLASLLPFEDLNGGHFFVFALLGLGASIPALLAAIGFAQRVRHPQTT